MTDVERAAFFSNLAYTAPDQRQAQINASVYSNYQIDPRFNEARHFAAHDATTRHTIIGHRGTADLADVQTDIGLAAGRLRQTQRFTDAYNFSTDVANAYGPFSPITHVGHSLGGTLADTISRQLRHQSIAFNRGSSPFESAPPVTDRHQHYRTSQDFISSFAPTTSTIEAQNHYSFYNRIQDSLSSFGYRRPQRSVDSIFSAYFGHRLSNFFW